MRDIALMSDLHKEVKYLQTTWDTSGLHSSIMKTLNSAGEANQGVLHCLPFHSASVPCAPGSLRGS